MSTIVHTRDSRGPSFASHRQALSGQPAEHLAAEIVEQARDEAQQILSHARATAAAVLTEAEQERVRQLAAQTESERRDVQREVTAARQSLAGVVAEIEARRHDWLAAWQQEALDLALAVAGRILRRDLDRESKLAVQLVREALELAAGAAKITVRVNPDDLTRFRDLFESVLQETHPVATPTLLSDPQVSCGGCRVETEFGEIDQTIETQLRRITEELCHGNEHDVRA